MPRAPSRICGCCGRAMDKAVAVHEGVAYCMTCYAREFRPVACDGCGSPVKTPGGRGPTTCKRCRTKDRSCLRCGKPTPRASLTLENGVACASCARYFKPPQPCPVCGQMSLHLARDFKAGFTEPVCPSCRTKGHITCPNCHKHRRPAGLDSAGRVVCKRCLETEGQTFVCPQCGKEGVRHSARRCEECYWTDTLDKRVRDARALLRGTWVQNAFSSFARELADRIGGKTTTLRLDRYFLFFAKLDAIGNRPDTVTVTTLSESFGVEGLRRHAVPFGFIVKAGIIPRPSTEILKAAQERDRQMRLLGQATGSWYADVAERYLQHLDAVAERYRGRGWTGTRSRMVPRTLTANLRTTLTFLKDADRAGVRAVQQIDQIHLDRFLLEHGGYRNAIRSFVRFLNLKEKLFRKLKIDATPQSVPEGIFLSQERYRTLLATLAAPGDDGLKESLICLMMLLYAQPASKLVRLKMSDLQRDRTGQYRVVFGSAEISLHERIGGLLDRYLNTRTALATMEDSWENAYLFPGRTLGSHLAEATVSYYLKKHGLNADQVFGTAIYQAYLNGVRHPKVLVRAFGITATTAVKYLQLIDPRLRDEVEVRASA